MKHQTHNEHLAKIPIYPTRLPSLLEDNLSIVFVGTESGGEIGRLKQYYADSSNRFYADLHAVGLAPRQVAPANHASS